MELIANVLMGAGALGAGWFCYVLSKRLSAFGTLAGGVGGAIALPSMRVEGLTKMLDAARKAASDSSLALQAQTERAEESAGRLELLLAALHDLPEAKAASDAPKRRVVHRAFRTQPAEAEASPGGFATQRADIASDEAA